MAWYTGLLGYLADVLMGIICLVWFIVMIKFPWDAYYSAKEVIDQIERSRKDKLAVDPEEEKYVRMMHSRILIVCLILHAASAGIVFGVAIYFKLVVGFAFGIFYMISSAFRPLHKTYQYLHNRFLEIQKAVRHPRNNILGYEEKTKMRIETMIAKFEVRVGDRKAKDMPRFEKDPDDYSYYDQYNGDLSDDQSLKARTSKYRADYKKVSKEMEFQKNLIRMDLRSKVDSLADSLQDVAVRVLEKPESVSVVKELVKNVKAE
jgi:hypothetical protein